MRARRSRRARLVSACAQLRGRDHKQDLVLDLQELTLCEEATRTCWCQVATGEA